MNTYRISLINKRLNFRRVVEVMSDTCVNAVKLAKSMFKGTGFDMLESAYLVAAA